MSIIIDKRLVKSSKSMSDIDRFKKRKAGQINAAINKAIQKGCITDFINNKPIQVPISDDIESIEIDKQNFEHVFIGNPKYRVGDTIPKPPSGGKGDGNQPGEGQTVIEVSPDEIKDIIFKNLELPPLVSTAIQEHEVIESKNAGYQTTGLPSNLSVMRSFKNSLGRKVALEAAYDEAIQKIKDELVELYDIHDKHDAGDSRLDYTCSDEQIKPLEAELEELYRLRESIPYLEDIDLRYRHREDVKTPISKGVLFCIMDVSGSMDTIRKSCAKVMFLLMYMFIKDQYEKFDVVFIKHHESATVCSEQEFFNNRESGGTSFISAYELLYDQIETKYHPSKYNIYIAQASDGENFAREDGTCKKFLDEYILKLSNLFLFIGCDVHVNTIAEYVEYVYSSRKSNLKTLLVRDPSECLSEFIRVFSRKYSNGSERSND